jgi:hypothetical protein
MNVIPYANMNHVQTIGGSASLTKKFIARRDTFREFDRTSPRTERPLRDQTWADSLNRFTST